MEWCLLQDTLMNWDCRRLRMGIHTHDGQLLEATEANVDGSFARYRISRMTSASVYDCKCVCASLVRISTKVLAAHSFTALGRRDSKSRPRWDSLTWYCNSHEVGIGWSKSHYISFVRTVFGMWSDYVLRVYCLRLPGRLRVLHFEQSPHRHKVKCSLNVGQVVPLLFRRNLCLLNVHRKLFWRCLKSSDFRPYIRPAVFQRHHPRNVPLNVFTSLNPFSSSSIHPDLQQEYCPAVVFISHFSDNSWSRTNRASLGIYRNSQRQWYHSLPSRTAIMSSAKWCFDPRLMLLTRSYVFLVATLQCLTPPASDV